MVSFESTSSQIISASVGIPKDSRATGTNVVLTNSKAVGGKIQYTIPRWEWECHAIKEGRWSMFTER
jgi:hypothetical protein